MKNAWQVLRGQERLSIVFWLYCVLGTIVASTLVIFAVMRLPETLEDVTGAALSILYLAYLLWAHVSLWDLFFHVDSEIEVLLVQ